MHVKKWFETKILSFKEQQLKQKSNPQIFDTAP